MAGNQTNTQLPRPSPRLPKHRCGTLSHENTTDVPLVAAEDAAEFFARRFGLGVPRVLAPEVVDTIRRGLSGLNEVRKKQGQPPLSFRHASAEDFGVNSQEAWLFEQIADAA